MHSVLSLAKYFASNYIFVLISWQCFPTNSKRERERKTRKNVGHWRCRRYKISFALDFYALFFHRFSVKYCLLPTQIQLWYRILTTRTFSYSNSCLFCFGKLQLLAILRKHTRNFFNQCDFSHQLLTFFTFFLEIFPEKNVFSLIFRRFLL